MFAILTGVFGAVVAVPVLARLRVRDDAAKGLGMALSATLTAFALPYAIGWLESGR